MNDNSSSSVLSRYFDIHPNLFLALILGVGGVGGAAFNPFVLSSDYNADRANTASRLSDMEYNLCQFRLSQNIANTEQTIRQLNTLMWDLERAIESSSGAARARDLQLLSTTKSDLSSAEAQRRALYNRNCVKSEK